MIPAVRIVPVALYLLRGNGNVFPVLPPPRVDVAADVLDFSRVAVRLVAAALGRIIRHVPARVKLLVQDFILRGMMVLRRRGRDCKDEPYREVCRSHAPSSLS